MCLLSQIPTDIANAVTVIVPPISRDLGTTYTKQQIQDLVDTYATQYNVDGVKMMATIYCESHYKNVQSDIVSNGRREDSWGIAQINLYWNSSVSKSQALDPTYSVEWMAIAFSSGEAKKWSCYRLLYQ